jgi:hypothetical protein
MSWNTRMDLHLDVAAPYGRVLLTSATNSALLNLPPDIVSGDRLTIALHFHQRGSAPGSLTPADPGEDAIIRFSGRAQSGGDLLFLADSFTEEEEGIWSGEADFHTVALAALLEAAPAGPKRILGEVEVRSGTSIRSYQFDLTARPEIYANQDSPAGLPDPDAFLTARAVRYDIAQDLTDPQKTQARDNIGLPSFNVVFITANDYAALTTEQQNDPAIWYVIDDEA